MDRCPFCHNPELVVPELFGPTFDERDVFEFLEKRRGQLQGVVITGAFRADGVFAAVTVLAKHDEKYMPPEVARSLKQRGLWREGSGAK